MDSKLKKLKSTIFLERTPIYAAAPTQQVSVNAASLPLYPNNTIEEKDVRVIVDEASKLEDVKSFREPNAFDKITRIAGSKITFLVILMLVGAWVLFGLIDGISDTWQIVFQNASSIQVYVTDILLIRQQQNASRALLTTIAEIQSRIETCERLLTHISGYSTDKSRPKVKVFENSEANMYDMAATSNRLEYVWNTVCRVIAQSLGSIWSFILYWIAIAVWIALGPKLQFSNTWQLYVNTGTAVLLTFTSVFLQSIQQHQEDKLAKCLEQILQIDAGVEKNLRVLTGDKKPNPIVTIEPAPRTFIDRRIDGFADIMGSGVGVAISLLFTVVWISFGPLLKFEDNWWLMIGTFTGLVGFVDGFVLRSLYFRDEKHTKLQFQQLASNEDRLISQLELNSEPETSRHKGLAECISLTVSDICGHSFASVLAVIAVIGLLTTATGMRWTETGQLLCNTPTMILEGFLLLVLIQAHNNTNEERNTDFAGLLRRKLLLESYVRELQG